MPITKFPEFEIYPEFKGLFVGGCVHRGDGSSFRAMAHAHTAKTDESNGWICVRSSKRIRMADGKPSRLMLHELGHLLAQASGHNKQWAVKVKELGGTLDWYKRFKGIRKGLAAYKKQIN